MRHTLTILVALTTLTGCPIDGWPDPADLPDVPDPDPVEPDGDDCEGVPSVAADDPCCAVHQCLLEAGPAACAEVEACNGLVEAGTVCGDQLCDGIECSSCVDPCEPALACAEMFVDSFAGDECAAWDYCRPEWPDCVGAAMDELGCAQAA